MKIDLTKIVKKKFPKIKGKKINKNTDLIEDLVLDSLELMNLILELEKKHNFKTKIFLKKNNKFQIKLIENFIDKIS